MDKAPHPRPASLATNTLVRLAVCAGVLLALLYASRWASMAYHHEFDPVDFYSFYTGASLVRDGHGDRLYDFGLQSRYELELLGELPLNGNLLPFISPPHLALVLLPFSLLPLSTALKLWLAVQGVLAVLLLVGCLTARRVAWTERVLLGAAVVASPLLTVTLYKGQVTLIVLIAVLLWIRALRAGADRGIAGWLLVGTIKLQLITVPLLVVIMARRWRALGIFVAGVSAIALGCAAVLGTSCVRDFLVTLRSIDATFDHRIVYPRFMYNFKGVLTLLLGTGRPALLQTLTHLGLIGSWCATVALWRGRVDSADERFELKLALSLLLGLFFTPHLYSYDALMLVAAGGLFHQYLRRSEGLTPWLFVLTAIASAPLFLESSWFVVGQRMVRWPSALMVAWMIWMVALLVPRQRVPSAVRSVRSGSGIVQPAHSTRHSKKGKRVTNTPPLDSQSSRNRSRHSS